MNLSPLLWSFISLLQSITVNPLPLNIDQVGVSLINIERAFALSPLCGSVSFTLELSPEYRKLIKPVLSPLSGMQKEYCIEFLNELGGQYWPQHQLTQLLIMALIRAAEAKSPCNPEYKCPAEKCRRTRAHAHTLTAAIQKFLSICYMRKDKC